MTLAPTSTAGSRPGSRDAESPDSGHVRPFTCTIVTRSPNENGWLGTLGAAKNLRAATPLRFVLHSPPMRAPFSATERFINRTTGASRIVTKANSQKQSK